MRILILIVVWMVNLPLWAQGSQTFLSEQIKYRNGEIHQDNAWDKDFFETHQMVFFFASTCPHCHNVSPHLKRWADEHHAVVQAFSFDNKPLPEFFEFSEASREIVDAAYEKRSIEYPALYIVNMDTYRLYPVVIGEFTQPQLEKRMQDLIQKIKRYEGA